MRDWEREGMVRGMREGMRGENGQGGERLGERGNEGA